MTHFAVDGQEVWTVEQPESDEVHNFFFIESETEDDDFLSDVDVDTEPGLRYFDDGIRVYASRECGPMAGDRRRDLDVDVLSEASSPKFARAAAVPPDAVVYSNEEAPVWTSTPQDEEKHIQLDQEAPPVDAASYELEDVEWVSDLEEEYYERPQSTPTVEFQDQQDKADVDSWPRRPLTSDLDFTRLDVSSDSSSSNEEAHCTMHTTSASLNDSTSNRAEPRSPVPDSADYDSTNDGCADRKEPTDRDDENPAHAAVLMFPQEQDREYVVSDNEHEQEPASALQVDVSDSAPSSDSNVSVDLPPVHGQAEEVECAPAESDVESECPFDNCLDDDQPVEAFLDFIRWHRSRCPPTPDFAPKSKADADQTPAMFATIEGDADDNSDEDSDDDNTYKHRTPLYKTPTLHTTLLAEKRARHGTWRMCACCEHRRRAAAARQ